MEYEMGVARALQRPFSIFTLLNSYFSSRSNFAKTYRCVIASQCAHWRGNLKTIGCILDNPKDPFRTKNIIYYSRSPISFGTINE